MLNKKITIITTGLIIIVGLLISGVLSSQKETMKRNSHSEKKQEVKTLKVENQDIQTEFEISGTLSAFNKIDIYAEVSGILQATRKSFKVGNRFSKDEVLIKIDDEVYRNNLLAQKSSLLNQLTLLLPDLQIDFPKSAKTWNGYLNDFDLAQPLKSLPETASDRERNYVAARDIYNQYYSIKSMEATLAKYTISAPYSGVVTESDINPGTLVRSGQNLGEFTNTEVYELEASVGLEEVQHLNLGDRVRLTSDDFQTEFAGTVQRINEKIDQSSQTVKAYITVNDKRLKDGMYLTAHITTNKIKNAIKVPGNLLIDKDKLYVLQDSVLVLQPIEVAGDDNGQTIIRGLQNGALILAEAIDGAFDGMIINQVAMN